MMGTLIDENNEFLCTYTDALRSFCDYGFSRGVLKPDWSEGFSKERNLLDYSCDDDVSLRGGPRK